MIMTKVAHIVWGFRTGGIETMLVNILNRQVEDIEVVLIIINDLIEPQLIELLDSRVKVVKLARKVGSRNPLPLLRLNMLLLKERPSVIHSHSFTVINYFLPAFRKKSILTYHTTLTDGVTRSVLQKYSRIYSISKSVSRTLLEQFGVKSKGSCSGIRFCGRESKEDIYPHNPIRIVQIGRLKSYKGHTTALEALSNIKDVNWHFDIIGEGELLKELTEYVSQNSLEDRVTFLGNKSQQYIFSHLKEYDILLQPSLWEGFGLSVAEAMAAKVAVVVSDADALTEVVDNGEYGYVFRAGNSNLCAASLRSAIDNCASKDALDKAYCFALKSFDINNTATAYINEYKDESFAN